MSEELKLRLKVRQHGKNHTTTFRGLSSSYEITLWIDINIQGLQSWKPSLTADRDLKWEQNTHSLIAIIYLSLGSTSILQILARCGQLGAKWSEDAGPVTWRLGGRYLAWKSGLKSDRGKSGPMCTSARMSLKCATLTCCELFRRHGRKPLTRSAPMWFKSPG